MSNSRLIKFCPPPVSTLIQGNTSVQQQALVFQYLPVKTTRAGNIRLAHHGAIVLANLREGHQKRRRV